MASDEVSDKAGDASRLLTAGSGRDRAVTGILGHRCLSVTLPNGLVTWICWSGSMRCAGIGVVRKRPRHGARDRTYGNKPGRLDRFAHGRSADRELWLANGD